MRNYVMATVAAAALLAAQPTYAEEPRVIESITAFSDEVQLTFQDVADLSSFVFLSIAGTGVFCSGLVDAADLVDVSTTAKSGTGSIDHVIDELNCQNGAPPASVSVECEADGEFTYHSVGNTTQVNHGVRIQFHGNTRMASAVCDIQVDGVTSEGFGQLYRSKEHN